MDVIDGFSLMAHELARGNIELNHRSATKPSTKIPFSLPLSSSNEHCQDRSVLTICLEIIWNLAADGFSHEFCTKCALYLSTTNITTSKTSQATHTRLSPMPSPSLQRCLFHQTFPYNNNNKNRNIIKNKYAECSHGRIPQVVPK
ncbi:hypothetical protein F2Q68_00031882 [Brassica cretica]|uniref:Uncharacterized protein n=1 Tax=Brassica cretica TaxID=69181 RepID=A0A8S9G7F5_BRACR|nr:hypothetical protein F2Q68_00031882 [Brassica cretica]